MLGPYTAANDDAQPSSAAQSFFLRNRGSGDFDAYWRFYLQREKARNYPQSVTTGDKEAA